MISLYVLCKIKKKKKHLIETENRFVVARGRQWGLEGNG